VKAVRVLAVADASVLAGFRRALTSDGMELVATASTLSSALSQLRRVAPDVVILDAGLAQTDAFAVLAQLLEDGAAPVLVLTSGDHASAQAERARAAGASDALERPVADAAALVSRVLALSARRGQRASLPLKPLDARPSHASAARASLPLKAALPTADPHGQPQLRASVPQQAALSSSDALGPSQLRAPAGEGAASQAPQLRASIPQKAITERPADAQLRAASAPRVVVIGASTGGTLALTELLRELPVAAPPVLVVQHMLPEFTRDFAERLDAACALEVREALDGEPLRPGTVRLAPGGRHLRVVRDASGQARVHISDDAPVGKHRPSVDVLFFSCAEVFGARAAGVLLTGMGDDGARGLFALRTAGARTLVQDPSNSACVGMPSAAIALGAVQHVLTLPELIQALQALCARGWA
jgi:two-component system, chemotaxis family, protein-glutamate methylesterase/glutaminase